MDRKRKYFYNRKKQKKILQDKWIEKESIFTTGMERKKKRFYNRRERKNKKKILQDKWKQKILQQKERKKQNVTRKMETERKNKKNLTRRMETKKKKEKIFLIVLSTRTSIKSFLLLFQWTLGTQRF